MVGGAEHTTFGSPTTTGKPESRTRRIAALPTPVLTHRMLNTACSALHWRHHTASVYVILDARGALTDTIGFMQDIPKKSLGQHWLHDSASLQAMVKAATITDQDTVLEIGPGLGTLTKYLVELAQKVVAVEFDEALARRLKDEIKADNLVIIHQDILEFDLGQMPVGYKVAANIPYYITGKLLRMFSDTTNKPQKIALLVQKEVAERIAAEPGEMSILSVGTQLEYEVKLGKIVEAKLFTPSPKVDSQIVILSKRKKPLFDDLDKKQYMHIV